MGAKGPTKKDLPPKSPEKVKGGGWSSNDNVTFVRAATAKAKGKDLSPKSPTKVKGGGWLSNDNITLVVFRA